ncbi:MAG: hypothetical protein WKF73_20750 [Nocardioidaceae bacterium]
MTTRLCRPVRLSAKTLSHNVGAYGVGLTDNLVLLIGIAVLVYTFVPIGYVIALSFSKPTGTSGIGTVRDLHLGQLDHGVRARRPVRFAQAELRRSAWSPRSARHCSAL